MIEEEWATLVEVLKDMAEGFAATDPSLGHRYRIEAADFAALGPPSKESEMVLREANAETIKRRWTKRLRRKRP